MLSFKSFEDKYFFWFQNPDENEDSQFVTKVNEMINKDLDKEEEKKPAPTEESK